MPAEDPSLGSRWAGAVGRRIEPLCLASLESTRADGGGVTVLSSHGVRELVYASDLTGTVIEGLHRDLEEGPAIDAASSRLPVLIGDVSDPAGDASARWPFFLPALALLDVGSLFAFPVTTEGVLLGTLALHRRRVGALERGELAAALLSAEVMGLALLGSGVPAGDTMSDTGEPGSDGSFDGSGDGVSHGVARSDQDGRPRFRPGAHDDFPGAAVHQAAGMVMVQLDGTIEEAMAWLRATAFLEGTTLQAAAAEVVDGHRRFAKDER